MGHPAALLKYPVRIQLAICFALGPTMWACKFLSTEREQSDVHLFLVWTLESEQAVSFSWRQDIQPITTVEPKDVRNLLRLILCWDTMKALTDFKGSNFEYFL